MINSGIKRSEYLKKTVTQDRVWRCLRLLSVSSSCMNIPPSLLPSEWYLLQPWPPKAFAASEMLRRTVGQGCFLCVAPVSERLPWWRTIGVKVCLQLMLRNLVPLQLRDSLTHSQPWPLEYTLTFAIILQLAYLLLVCLTNNLQTSLWKLPCSQYQHYI